MTAKCEGRWSCAEVHVSLLTAAVAEMCREANYYLGADIISALQKA